MPTALRHVGGHVATLERVLHCSVDTYRTGMPALEQAAPTWRAACHSLLGVSGTVGAEPLQQRVLAFQHAVSQADDASALTAQAQALQRSLLGLVSRIEAALAL